MRRKTIVYVAAMCVAAVMILSVYFLSHKPERASKVQKRSLVTGQISGDVKFSSEAKGFVNWEIRAKVAKNMDKPRVELEGIEGEYRPNPDTTVRFKGSKGELDREKGIGHVEDVDLVYKGEYRMMTHSMDFDMNKSLAMTKAPVTFEGEKFTLMGVGFNADIKEQVINVERDVNGTIERDKGKIKFSSDRFTYFVKKNTYLFDGQVVVKGDEMSLLCDKVYVRTNQDNKPEKMDAQGRVKILTKGTIAKSERAVYYFREEKVMLEGSPRVTRNNVQMEGGVIVYDLSKDRFSVEKPRMRIEQPSG
jgi:lipopolysaccharide transport protein LptA/LPS export ABC transporter protein LptC